MPDIAKVLSEIKRERDDYMTAHVEAEKLLKEIAETALDIPFKFRTGAMTWLARWRRSLADPE